MKMTQVVVNGQPNSELQTEPIRYPQCHRGDGLEQDLAQADGPSGQGGFGQG
jgi:hypothetical protein